jgi:hypothetical protein
MTSSERYRRFLHRLVASRDAEIERLKALLAVAERERDSLKAQLQRSSASQSPPSLSEWERKVGLVSLR